VVRETPRIFATDLAQISQKITSELNEILCLKSVYLFDI
jgi:hypothetical protein